LADELIAENEEETKCMMVRLERYLEKKKLELNADKIKITRFRKEGRRIGRSGDKKVRELRK